MSTASTARPPRPEVVIGTNKGQPECVTRPGASRWGSEGVPARGVEALRAEFGCCSYRGAADAGGMGFDDDVARHRRVRQEDWS